MGHASIENRTPFAFAALHLCDEEGRPVLVCVVRATYTIAGRQLTLADEQAPIGLAGQLHGESPLTSSYRFEPESAFVKPATDVVLLGHAYAPRVGAVEVPVGVQVGPVQRSAVVIGDRFWVRSAGAVTMTRPQPFEKIPLRWERAFGGRDRTEIEPRNPVGTGFRSRSSGFEEGVRLPNLEDPTSRISAWAQVATPVGFGFTSPDWQPRLRLAGTHDAAWKKDRMPLFPSDFDRRFFCSAAPGLTAPGHLRGDEQVAVVGASPLGSLAFRLPAAPPPVCRVSLALRADATVHTELDTVVIDTDEDRVHLTWRGHVALRRGPHDVRSVVIETPGVSWPERSSARGPTTSGGTGRWA